MEGASAADSVVALSGYRLDDGSLGATPLTWTTLQRPGRVGDGDPAAASLPLLPTTMVRLTGEGPSCSGG